MKNPRHTFIFTLLIGSVLMIGCDTDNLFEEADTYDQALFLDHTGNTLIIPSVEDFLRTVTDLKSSVDLFVQEPTADVLVIVRQDLKVARLSWQWVQPFAFGPMSKYGLQGVTSIYPVDVQQLERNISAGDYSFGTVANIDAVGFQALGYLLYGDDLSDEDLLLTFESEARRKYLQDVVKLIFDSAENANEEVVGYVNDVFSIAGAEGIDAGSSTAIYVNALNQNFERNLRDGKLAIPLGVRSLGNPVMKAAEAYYAGYSVELLQESMKAYQAIYEGAGRDGTEGEGFFEYLKAIKAQSAAEEDLADVIRGQIEDIENLTIELEGDLPTLIEQRPEQLEQLFVEMQRLVVYLKTDMASALGVIIVYQDNDGD
ncbi:MAG: putative lipoprotein [Cyclobacteriaceae bacterium]|jgi:predicted lipoprotein